MSFITWVELYILLFQPQPTNEWNEVLSIKNILKLFFQNGLIRRKMVLSVRKHLTVLKKMILATNRKFWNPFWSQFLHVGAQTIQNIFFWTTKFLEYLQKFFWVPSSNLKWLYKKSSPPPKRGVSRGGCENEIWRFRQHCLGQKS